MAVRKGKRCDKWHGHQLLLLPKKVYYDDSAGCDL